MGADDTAVVQLARRAPRIEHVRHTPSSAWVDGHLTTDATDAAPDHVFVLLTCRPPGNYGN